MKTVLLTATVVLAVLAMTSAQNYRITNLPGFVPLAINSSGELGGQILLPGNVTHAALWTRDGGTQDLGTLGGSNASVGFLSTTGEAFGTSNLAGDSSQHAFLWKPNQGMLDLGSLGGDISYVTKISTDGGFVMGYSQVVGGSYDPFLWSPSLGMQDFDALVGEPVLMGGVNNAGQVAFTAQGAAFLWSAPTGSVPISLESATGLNDAATVIGDSWLFEAGSWKSGVSTNFGSFGGSITEADFINAADLVTGYSMLPGDHFPHAFVWSWEDQTLRDINTKPYKSSPSSQPFGLNDKGVVFGWDSPGTAWIWSEKTKKVAVGGIKYPTYSGINDAGQIIGATKNGYAVATPVMHIAINSSSNPSTGGQEVLFSITVSSLLGPPPDQEAIVVKDGTKLLATLVLLNGTASFSTSSLKTGTHNITGRYVGDINYSPEKSKALKQVVNP